MSDITATARRLDGYAHEVDVDGHQVVIDEPEDEGGTDKGPRPTRMLAGSLAACTAITVEMYADRKGWDLGDVEVNVEGKIGTADTPTRFTVVVRLPVALTEEQVQRLSVIAGKCPVHRALAGNAEVTDLIETAPRSG